MDLIIASNNKNKIREIKGMFKDIKIPIYSLEDKGISMKIIEDRDTIEENSLKKAKEVYRYLKDKSKKGFLVLSDDSGLVIEYLNGAPGVMSARFAGNDATYEENVQKVLKLLNGVEYDRRNAKFLTVLTLIDELGNVNQFFGELYGRIIDEKRGTNGFAYDSVFFLENEKKTLAELTFEEKNLISHRRKALDKFLDYIEKNYESKNIL